MTLSKSEVMAIYRKVWDASDPDNQLTGHSFRVGGATLRWNDDIPLNDIVKVGRWKSKAYELYLRKYTKEQAKDAKYVWSAMADPDWLLFDLDENKVKESSVEKEVVVFKIESDEE